MKRDTHFKVDKQRFQNYVELVSRVNLAIRMGLHYGGDRDVYEALGYDKNPKYEDYLSRYLRQDIAKAIIDRPVDAVWQGPLDIVIPDQPDSELEKAWKKLSIDLGLKSKFNQLDKLAGIGEYGVLLLGVNGVRAERGFANPIRNGRELLYVKPYGQGNVEIKKYVQEPTNERYGLPEMYTLNGEDNESRKSITIDIHQSRVIHVISGSLDSEVKGLPRLQAVYNRLMDLEKLVGGSAEMYWRGARPGYTGEVDPDYQLTDPMRDDLQDQLDEYDHHLRRFIINEGVKLKALEQEISDPTGPVDIQVQMIAAETKIPKRILMGSERGELSSGQDRTEWLHFVKTRREEYAEPIIVRPFVDKCMEFGILPEAEGYRVQWEDIFAPSEKDKVNIGEGRARALKEYSQNPMAEVIVPPKQFLKKLLGFSEEEVEEIMEAVDQEMLEELKELKDALTGGPPELTPAVGGPEDPGGAQQQRQPEPAEA
jgi:hypothetical protein